jgi:tetratricopeptide (TPR) repeat protein
MVTEKNPLEEERSSAITYPFYERDESIGQDRPDDKFVIRTLSGSTEYTVEIPQGAKEYDVEVPIAKNSPDAGDTPRPRNFSLTDRELVADMPKLEGAGDDQALTDKMLGVAPKEGPGQSPSYVLGIEKISKLYRENKFEVALIEINNLLSYYPTSTKLYKMKGTVLLKLGNYQLAEKSWTRAYQLSPDDSSVKKSLEYLRQKIERQSGKSGIPEKPDAEEAAH